MGTGQYSGQSSKVQTVNLWQQDRIQHMAISIWRVGKTTDWFSIRTLTLPTYRSSRYLYTSVVPRKVFKHLPQSHAHLAMAKSMNIFTTNLMLVWLQKVFQHSLHSRKSLKTLTSRKTHIAFTKIKCSFDELKPFLVSVNQMHACMLVQKSIIICRRQ